MKRGLRAIVLRLAAVLLLAQAGAGYSVLTHEQIVDLLWEDRIQPMLKARFPGITDADLKQAHAYAYGGSLVQDMGYYPFGNKYFSNITHYVRTGDFVMALVAQAQTANEFAFGLGALAHYASDNDGHPMVNHTVATEFPELRQKFGDSVTYADSPTAHIRAEFGFDMVQVAKNHYTSDRYHDFIGFEVSQSLLQRVFPQIYGIEFKDVVHDEDLAIGTFRHAVSQVIPEVTRVALLTHKDEIVADTPNAAEKKYLYYLSRTDYEREWGQKYRKPGLGTRILAAILKIFPKSGPFSGLNFKVPPPAAENQFVESVDKTVKSYRIRLEEVQAGTLHLANTDCDTGNPTERGEYSLADRTYRRLLHDLAKSKFKQVSPELQENVLGFYSGAKATASAAIEAKPTPKERRRTREELRRLRAATAATSAAK
jgi:hypothetical protein